MKGISFLLALILGLSSQISQGKLNEICKSCLGYSVGLKKELKKRHRLRKIREANIALKESTSPRNEKRLLKINSNLMLTSIELKTQSNKIKFLREQLRTEICKKCLKKAKKELRKES